MHHLIHLVLYSFLALHCVIGLNISMESKYISEDLSKSSDSTSKCDINNILENFSLSIKPSNNFYQKGRKIAEQVFKIVKKSHYDVYGYIIAGSVGKLTAVNKSADFDVVVFINNINPPHQKVIHELQQIVNKQSDEFENYKYRGTTDLLFKITVSEIRFDIIPTGYYSKPNSSNYKETFLKIKSFPNPFIHNYHYNSGFSEESVSLGKRQSAFVHSIVRLAKYWNGKIYYTEFLNGRSLMMEFIAMKACEGVPENNFYLAFRKFLNMVADFDHLYIIFEDYYKISEIPHFILQYRGPILLNPINYYQNLGHHWHMSQSAIMTYKANAKISLDELEKWKANPCLNTKFFKKRFFNDYSREYQINVESDCQPTEYYSANLFSRPSK